jgi:hypothetical protein
MDDKTQAILEMTQAMGSTHPGPMAVNSKGHLCLAVLQGIAILAADENHASDAAVVLGIANEARRRQVSVRLYACQSMSATSTRWTRHGSRLWW